MIKVFNEIALVEKIKANGMVVDYSYECGSTPTNSDNFVIEEFVNTTELQIYLKYLRSLGGTPKNMKSDTIKVWKNYNPLKDYETLNKNIMRICRKYKKMEPKMKEIKEVSINQSTLDWFLALKDYKIPEDIQKRRKVKYISWGWIKVLFTLYIWSKIQEQFKSPEKAQWVNCDGSIKWLKECSDWNDSGWKWSQMIGTFFDMGIIELSFSNPKCLRFKKKFEDGDLVVDTLEQSGKWFDYQRGKIARCPKCGNYFYKKAKTSKETCEECRKAYQREKKREYRAREKMGG